MEFKNNIKKYVPLVVFILMLILIFSLLPLYLPTTRTKEIPGERKAIILCSANDFYRKENFPDFNDGGDSNFSGETNNWPSFVDSTNGYIVQESNLPGHDTPGFVQFIVKTPATPKYVNMEYVYNWTNFHPLFKYAAYNLSGWVNITTNINTPPVNPTVIVPPGAGARIGLRWLNSSNGVVRTDWSKGIYGPFAGWSFLNATGVADSTLDDITQLHLVLAVEGNMTGGEMVLFDDIKVEYWFPPPIPSPPPSNVDTDGFPAQALQVYWILKEQGYTDDNIFLMLYHTGDDIIDIDASDGFLNDLNRSGVTAQIDVENDDVNATRFKQELDVSNSGFASNINSKDQLILYMVDHGSNTVLGDGNATFHFEADDSYITELEFFNLVKQINCERMLINIDICFSGNFLNENLNIGTSWYDLPNALLITSTTDIFSWCWRNNNNADGFAGSWFFHPFWDQLNKNMTIESAFNFAKDWIPSGQVLTINDIQSPLIYDNLGISTTWSFNNTPQL
ncbi:MAG: C13 family peptidase [Candidatus Thorarchaeota archaeon]